MFSRLIRTSNFIPPNVSGNILWLRSDLGVDSTTNPGEVTSWADQSGAGIITSLTAISTRPTYSSTGGPNNVPRIIGNAALGSGVRLGSGTNLITAGSNRTVYVVCKAVTQGTGGSLVTFRRSGALCTLQLYSSSFVYSDGVSINNNTSPNFPSITGTTIVRYRYSSGSKIECRINGADQTITGGNVTTESGTAGFDIFGRADAGQGWVGDIYEVIVYNSLLSTDNMTTIENYLSTRYT